MNERVVGLTRWQTLALLRKRQSAAGVVSGNESQQTRLHRSIRGLSVNYPCQRF